MSGTASSGTRPRTGRSRYPRARAAPAPAATAREMHGRPHDRPRQTCLAQPGKKLACKPPLERGADRGRTRRCHPGAVKLLPAAVVGALLMLGTVSCSGDSCACSTPGRPRPQARHRQVQTDRARYLSGVRTRFTSPDVSSLMTPSCSSRSVSTSEFRMAAAHAIRGSVRP